MIQEQAKKGSFSISIQDRVSAIVIKGDEAIASGTVKLTYVSDSAGKQPLCDEISILKKCEGDKFGYVINKADQCDVSFQVSDFGNLEFQGTDYLLIEFSNLNGSDGDETFDVHSIAAHYGSRSANITKEHTVLAGVKAVDKSTAGVDELWLDNDNILTEITLYKGGKGISYSKTELETMTRMYNMGVSVIDAAGTHYGFKTVLRIPLNGAESVRLETTGASAYNFWLNKLG